ncbi:efflux transporter outer membrane subunit [Xanthomonas translucens]|uniref:efflux transporter outer membrane subunit n=2 Tax=Xanthomonas campestris pv. translucens TaxID=343 RepID=UPI00071E8E9B|nr:efflux transporter outer membrane subunit [Xanthomonas translucens]KTF40426.1 transporter [Xanthomonas translucens pv. translucens]MCT8274538.1 efflux transporter outer membrane subunit [Xanthomonas translucens pv. translucens]MCT8278449.1 efflux transporter outer membrane subunit [Xanthomonas translucens pv. translucens]MCT8307437.1 efflux transporter outer membrane subunit [Xanthomonas translucens pv. translucens]MQS40225.1 efflux transporter outer membrane subunit [Xanthomonas translucen
MSARSPRLLALACCTALAACSMAPHYARPAAPVPLRFDTAGSATPAADAALALPDWREVFLDPRLRQVIALGLDNNRDLRMAMLAIDKARAQYRIQRAALAPALDATASSSRQRTSASASASGQAQIDSSDTVQVGISSWELDLFGRVRSLKDEALETWLASAETQRSVRLSLIGQIADAWLAVGADQQSLALAQQTLDSQEQTLRRSRAQHDNGIGSGLDLAQIQSSVEAARVAVARAATQLAQARDALQLVVGAPVDAALLAGTDAFDGSVALAPVPAQLDAAVLLQRPDVLAAEHALKAANADIGAARAAFFPTVSLTASSGRSSDALSTLFAAGSRTWAFVPSIALPIFHAGALKASLDVSRIGKNIAVAQYEKAIQSAFSDVADALAQRDHLDAQLSAQRALVEAVRRSHTLAEARYRAGVDGYLQVLDAQRSLYAAQQDLIALRLQDDSNRVALYTVLGGGADARATAPAAASR